MPAPRIALFTTVVLLLAGCATGGYRTAVRPAAHTVVQARQAEFTEAELALIEENCPFGRPKVGAGFGPTRFVIRNGYVLEHSSTDRIPIWVCEGVTVAELGGNVPRKNRFKADPKLPAGERAELSDYAGSGFDRGHMAPAGNQTVDTTLKYETFYLSNMAPQAPLMNQRIWETLEGRVRDWLRARGGGQVITGGFFFDPEEEDAATADGLIDYGIIGNGVAVPTHFYKVVVARENGAPKAIAFVMENRTYPAPFDFSEFIRSVDWIEERAGVDFMPDLDADEEEDLEMPTPALWQ